MKTSNLIRLLFVFAVLVFSAGQVRAQGTAFTYQGRLNSGATLANGVYDFRFRLAYDALGNTYADGGTAVAVNAVGVSNGLFTANIDFGANVFTGPALFLEIGVRTNGGSSYTTLAPLQPLTATPYAMTASNVSGTVSASQLTGTVPAGQLAGTYPAQLTLNNPANAIAGTFAGDGSAISNVNALTLDGLGSSNFWQLNGNNVADGQFVGTVNNQPLELKANGQRALRIEPTTNAPNLIGGWSNNFVAPGVVNAVIGGGGGLSVISGAAYTNAVYGAYGTVGGGLGNIVGNPTNTDVSASRGATVGGGVGNNAQGGFSFIGGGYFNVAAGAGGVVAGGGSDGYFSAGNNASGGASFVGSGLQNSASSNWSAVVGGIGNEATGLGAFVGGGGATATNYYYGNTASGMSSVVPGGIGNSASGRYSFASGQQAIAAHDNTFVWADGIGGNFSSFTSNEFSLRALNGVRIQSDTGIHLNAADRPLIVRDWDVFSTNAPSSKIGIGRWGLFMEPDALTIGIPSNDVPGRYFQVAEYSTNGVLRPLMEVDQSGTVYADSFVGSAVNLYNINASNLIGTVPTWVQTGFQYPYDYIGGGVGNIASNYAAAVVSGESNTNFGPNSLIGGGYQNVIQNGNAAFIGGGVQNYIDLNSYESTIGGGYVNFIGANAYQATIGGGFNNRVANQYSTISGGQYNLASGDTSTVGGGNGNEATNVAATVSGGIGNVAGGFLANVGGGQGNLALANNSSIFSGLFNTNYGVLSFIGSGADNYISGFAATVPGGISNFAYGSYSFAAGYQAQAFNQGAFVWADSQPGFFGSTTNDEFNIRSLNGVRVQTGRGLHLDAETGPMVVRDFNPFAANAGSKAGLGRWGMFMESGNLVMGIPDTDVTGSLFSVAKYATNGNRTTLMQVTQGGLMYANTFSLPSTAPGTGGGFPSGAVLINGQPVLHSAGSSANIFVGAYAGKVDGTVTGVNNTGVGASALGQLTSGNNNIAIGEGAGSQIFTGSNNICIGNTGANTDNKVTRIGSGQTAAYVSGIYGATAASGVAVYVNSSGQLGTLTSSARYKKDIKEMKDASDALYSLKPVTFKYRNELDPSGTPQFGLVAEQVEKVDPSLVAHDEKGGIYTVRYQAVDAMLLNEFLKEHKKVQEQETKLSKQDAEIQALKESLQQLQKTVAQFSR